MNFGVNVIRFRPGFENGFGDGVEVAWHVDAVYFNHFVITSDLQTTIVVTVGGDDYSANALNVGDLVV